MSKCQLWGDENKLAQVIRNFISNALKFTPKGGIVKIKLSKYHIEPTGLTLSYHTSVDETTRNPLIGTDMLKIEVIDNGHGISQVYILYYLDCIIIL